MKYSGHRIKPHGGIEVVEEGENGIKHRFAIKPNQPIEKYKQQIESDPDFEKYRTQENADAYEVKLRELEPSAEELAGQEEKRKEKQKRDEALERLIQKELKEMEKE